MARAPSCLPLVTCSDVGEPPRAICAPSRKCLRTLCVFRDGRRSRGAFCRLCGLARPVLHARYENSSADVVMNGAELIARQLVRHGVHAVFGVGGANIEDLFLAVQQCRPELAVTLCKHEHNAGTAADAAARLSGGVGVVMATSGGGAMNLVPALAEAYASGVPVVALVGEPPRQLQGRGAFQDTSGKGETVDAQRVLSAVSRSCVRADSAESLASLVDDAVAQANSEPKGPAVILVAKDLQQATVQSLDVRGASHPPARQEASSPAPSHATDDPRLLARIKALLAKGPLLVVASARVRREGVEREFQSFVMAHDAMVGVTPDGRDAFDNRDPRFVGVIGAMGGPRLERALEAAGAVVLVGTALPLLARLGVEQTLSQKPILALHTAAPWVLSEHVIHVPGPLGTALTTLAEAAPPSAPERRRVFSREYSSTQPASEEESDGVLDFASSLGLVSSHLQPAGVLLVDAGNTGAAGVHYIDCPSNGRCLIAMGMAGMGYTFGAAIGATVTTGRRCTVVAGDGAFYMHGLEIHTAVEHRLPITYLLLDNHAHGMCLVREELLLGRRAGYNSFRPANLAGGLSALFPGLFARSCRTRAELERALVETRNVRGPAVLAVELGDVEIPPFSAFLAEAARRSIKTVGRDES